MIMCCAPAGCEEPAVRPYAAGRTPDDPQPTSTMPGIRASAPTDGRKAAHASSLDRLRPLKVAISAKLRGRSPAITR
ncbi:hypothetical protein GCM10023195_58990 [Actinoallomurus liliacearum]|uniref:Uncharacterized protein n=1 Tax=Actinoallomurus liliacearum TaxID=1080073 RepID=A0ABP8TQ29_9ACTN